MFYAGEARVSFYSQETGDYYDVGCYQRMTSDDCKQVRGLSDTGADRLRVRVYVSRFQEMHNTLDYGLALLDAERSTSMRNLFECLDNVGISAYIDGLSWGLY